VSDIADPEPHRPTVRRKTRSDDPDRRGRSRPDARQRSEALKERVYVTFTALAVTIALGRDPDHVTVGTAALTLVLTVVGTLLAVFVADLVAHMIRESSLPDRAEIGHLLWVSFGSLGVLAVPLIVLGVQALGVLELAVALRAISVVLVATLVLVTLVAISRLQLRIRSKVLVLAGMTLLGLAVLAVELSVH